MKILLERSFKDANEESILDNDFISYPQDDRQEYILAYLKKLATYNSILKNASQYYAETISNIDSANKRKKYLDYLKQLEVPFNATTAEVIDDLIDEHLLDFSKDLPWINELNIRQDDRAIRNTIKTIAFFNDKDNRDSWKVSDDFVQTKLMKNGKPLDYSKISDILDQVEQANQGKKSSKKLTGQDFIRSKLNKNDITPEEYINFINTYLKYKLDNNVTKDPKILNKVEKLLKMNMISTLNKDVDENFQQAINTLFADSGKLTPVMRDAISALINLGTEEKTATELIKQIATDNNHTVDELVQQALKGLRT